MFEKNIIITIFFTIFCSL